MNDHRQCISSFIPPSCLRSVTRSHYKAELLSVAMAQSRETMSLVSDYLDEKVALNHFWADMYAESELLLNEKVKVKPLKSGMTFAGRLSDFGR